MRAALISISLATLLGVSTAWAQAPPVDAPRRMPPGTPVRVPDADAARLFRYEPTGLSLLRPYRRGLIPVVFVHGLWAGPRLWAPMVKALEADPALRGRYQFWTFGYCTGDPFVYSARLLRRDLDEVRRKFDPDHTDPAFDRMVVVGHSMGGLLAKMMVQESGDALWRLLSDRPFEELVGTAEDRELVRQALFFEPRPEVRRVVFIATPHRGSRVDQGHLGRLGSRLVRVDEPLRAAYTRLITRNEPAFFKERLRDVLPTSIDELQWGSSVLTALSELGLVPGVAAHSIIADLSAPPRPGGGDGVVTYDSAHLDGVASEMLVPSGHLCLCHPAVIREVRRILLEHAVPPPSGHVVAGGAP